MLEATMDKIISLCKRRGFVYPSSEIYGGVGNLFDYGPLGVEMKQNIKKLWWEENVRAREEVFGLESAIVMHPKVWEASGHTTHFHDPLVDCKECKKRFRQDKLTGTACPDCGGELTSPRQFNLMFATHLGPVEEEGTKVYLRPETAQGMFADFLHIAASARAKLPFGIAQIGKSFRNEISPGNFIFRTREFEQMELEYFTHPEAGDHWFQYWRKERLKWYQALGISSSHLRERAHASDELAHYALHCSDIEYLFPFGWQELEGIAHRGEYDLSCHSQASGKELTLFDPERKEHIAPVCIESSAGVERTMLALLIEGYREETIKGETRVVLNLHPRIAPITCGILPLVNRDPLPRIAQEINEMLKRRFSCTLDTAGSIGRRYRRLDEIGTPYALTVDFQTPQEETVTLRKRSSTEQLRLPVKELPEKIASLLLSGEA